MIDEVDQRLKAWVGRIAGGTPVFLGVPDRDSLERGVCLYLLELGPAPQARAGRRTPLQISVCYLVTAGAASPEAAHRLLGELVFAAMEEPDFEVDLTPVATSVWTGLRVAPRPAFRVRVPVRRERPGPVLQPVRLPVVAQAGPAEALLGCVVGPGDVPIPGALVELPALRLTTRTDDQGCFRFPRVPPVDALGRLEVRANGALLALAPEALAAEPQPLLIRLPPKEE
ncbi:carboxypeptidase-like regulatory domain-containing protein [Myxococcus sp. K15C18031901]|uniref:carboxypeptidase-like regulatory domain-containing protein n=1 Tax=Myxococcus dinghuensis TaxID=2906761 RepID=UPI0020A80598|nr:carboxypeptidase-like regulatory domain-containing protein [Myxococcus dinghuensis]MCP3104372.1 carboxypeptidase-like regulatory domain-containing protein [Myxococcus dinghuensis]